MNKELFAGAIAGSLAAFAVVPLDVVKIRKQYWGKRAGSFGNEFNDNRNFKGGGGYRQSSTWRCLVQIVREEGFKGLYRGSFPSVFGYLCSWSVYFAVYENLREHLGGRGKDGEFHSNAFVDLVAATSAGFTSTTITSPIWVIRTKIMMTQHQQQKGDVKCNSIAYHIRQTWNPNVGQGGKGSFKGFWAGSLASYLGLVHVAVQWPVYEWLRKQIVMKHSSLFSSGNLLQFNDDDDTAVVLGASLTSKIVASIITYPHEVVRTRMQMAYSQKTHAAKTGLFPTIRNIWLAEGIGAFYKGLGTSILRQLPTTAIVFVVHNWIVKVWPSLTR